jgi:hypothetical protein
MLLCVPLVLSGCLFGGGTEDTNDIRVSGQVLDLDGMPAAAAGVVLYPAQWREPVAGSRSAAAGPESVATDAEGRFRFGHVAPGLYSIEGFRASDSMIAFTMGLDFRGQDQTLAPLALVHSGSLRGHIEGSSGAAIAALAGTPFRAPIDADGKFAFPILPPGRFELQFQDSSGEGEVFRATVDIAPEVDLSLAPIRLSLATAWRHRARMVVNTSADGADIRESLTGFPMLIRLDSAFDFSQARSNGEDLRFSGSDGSPLAHEVETWDPIGRRADIWVRLDTVFANSATQSVWMYWGNDTASDVSNGTAVFDTAEAFIGAWHLHQSPSGAAPQMRDASGNANHAALYGAAVASAAGISGAGLAFTGTDQYASMSRYYNDPDVFTISLWFRTNRAGGKLAGFESGTGASSIYKDRHIWLDDAGRLRFGVFPPAPETLRPEDSLYVRNVLLPGENPDKPDIQRILSSSAAYADGQWHQVVATLSKQGQFLFADGAMVASDPDVNDAAAYSGTWRFGGGTLADWVGAPQRGYFQGDMDEAGVANVARSPGWIRLSYLNLKSPGTFIRLEQPF